MVSNQRLSFKHMHASPLLQIRTAPNGFLSLRMSDRAVYSLPSCILCTLMIFYYSHKNSAPSIGVLNISSSNPTLADDICVITAVTWLKYWRYGVKLYPINQSVLLLSRHKASRMSSTASSNTPNASDLHLTLPNLMFFISIRKDQIMPIT